MKALLINGSPRPKGNTTLALAELDRIFRENGVETEEIRVGNKAIRDMLSRFRRPV